MTHLQEQKHSLQDTTRTLEKALQDAEKLVAAVEGKVILESRLSSASVVHSAPSVSSIFRNPQSAPATLSPPMTVLPPVYVVYPPKHMAPSALPVSNRAVSGTTLVELARIRADEERLRARSTSLHALLPQTLHSNLAPATLGQSLYTVPTVLVPSSAPRLLPRAHPPAATWSGAGAGWTAFLRGSPATTNLESADATATATRWF